MRNIHLLRAATASALALSFLPAHAAQTDKSDKKQASTTVAASDSSAMEKMIADWPNRPKLAAREMMGKYGAPAEITSERIIWKNPGAYKRIMVTREEIPHDFPKPHMDFLEHTIDYNVPQDKVADLIAFDASSTINRTAGELSARCDLEGHNVLTLNLDRDIIEGKKTVAEARKAFGDNVVQDVMGTHPAYVEELQFKPSEKSSARFSDQPVIPGSPKRAGEDGVEKGKTTGDAEVLAFVIAVDDNEILAAAEATKKKPSSAVLDYAKMMHQEHGKNEADTMELGQKISVTPIDTEAVDKLRVKGAGELAALIPLKGDEFEAAYVAAMVKGHTEVLEMIDSKLLKAAENEAVKKHLNETRSAVAQHLEMGKKLQASMQR
ncbi:MAG: DUF4142 domain-containing protein [Chthoniobacterales bacterium]|nr:DUF4142 domain-containing protein [Chthoniobacterales bacterium]